MVYKRIDENDSPIMIKDWVNANRSKEKDTVIEVLGKIYIVLTRGEKRTGGYDISIKNVDENEDELYITFQYEDPDANSIVMQILTYPVLILEIEKARKSIIYHVLKY